MKNNYFISALVFAFFCFFKLNAQSCPPTGFSDGDTLYFFYDLGTSDCMDRPVTVSVGASVFTLNDCGNVYSVYQLTSGSPISPTNMFTADFGYGTCEYTDGVLTGEFLSLEDFNFKISTLKVFPNPVSKGDRLNITFENAISTKIKLFNLTGKLVFEDSLNNTDSKTLDVNAFANGIYLLQITNGNVSVTKKVVIMK
ncbi:MAG: T9SS type A sorting domain-containing protein [Flavobacteriaceae bacterium]